MLLQVIDSKLAARYRAIGFDLKGSPVGEIPFPEVAALGPVRPLVDKQPVTWADAVEGLVHLNQPETPVTLAHGFLTEALVEQAKRDGWLPNVPSVTLDWIRQNAERLTKPKRQEGGR